MIYYYFLEGLYQTTNYADDNSLAFIEHDINVIKKDLELASEVAIHWFKDSFMKPRHYVLVVGI